MAMQQDYVERAFSDDAHGGVCTRTRSKMSASERDESGRQLLTLTALGSSGNEFFRDAGIVAERIEVDGLATQRRHFELTEFFVIGEPDACGSDLVIEFCRSRRPELAVAAKRVQANLYAVLWQVSKARVVVTDNVERIDEIVDADPESASEWISKAWLLFEGTVAPKPPRFERQCKPCEFSSRGGCPYPRRGSIPSHKEMKRIADRFSR